ncbi:Glycogen synthase [Sulfidibacter corallicola]|uniref:Glycogen synthase n=1 Tax=Sulfidibacter corallicola TaxID=2818388 RepID=A0A8A4TSI7_SULCO|nr:glycogen/starch synthase [Sulfidibacter corallicola]QTD52124.1 glycogen synthase [Sulfidibacter corallicola]
MKILIAAAEAVPFVKVGGMGDVVGSLPKALHALGVSVRVIMPGYGFIDKKAFDLKVAFTFDYRYRGETVQVVIYRTQRAGAEFFFVEAKPWFGEQSTVYSPDSEWDVPRFTLFSRLVLETMSRMAQTDDWTPDVLQVNDWHMGLLPLLLKVEHQADRWTKTASLLTIHNSAYQGENAGNYIEDLVPKRNHPDLLDLELEDNFLAIGVAYADKVNTVSQGFADEIKATTKPKPLEVLLQRRGDDFVGILNGLDYDQWDPQRDKHIHRDFHASQLETQRLLNKRFLQSSSGLPLDDEALLIGMVTRLVPQKGVDLALDALERLSQDRPWQLVVLGTGFDALEKRLLDIEENRQPDVRAMLRFDEKVARDIYAGCDLFLMPSRFEPCGMGQMMAMRYGALPLVHRTGGLADTVTAPTEDPDQATGFVFDKPEAEALKESLETALKIYNEARDTWRRMQRTAMARDFSWSASARSYLDLYRMTARIREGAHS